MPKLNMETLLPFIEEAFNRGADFQIPITGTSMNPLLYQNRDFVKIAKPVLPLKIGDIPLYRRRDGAFVLHRVVGIKPNGEYIMCGDNQFLLEHGITDANIIGIAKTLIINGRVIDTETDAEYLKHKEKYLKNLKTRYPVRRLRYKLHSIKCGIRNSEFGMSGAAHGDKKCGIRNSEFGMSGAAHGDKKCGIRNSEFGMNKSETQTVEDGFIRPDEDILNTGSILINAIRAQITGTDYVFPENTDFKMLYNLAQNHRVTAMVAPLIIKSASAPKEAKSIFSKELFKCAARYTAQEKEQMELSSVLSANHIRHCFLKGTKVGRFYDNPDIRFMLDMDLYVEKHKFSQAEKILVERGYERNSNGDDKDTAYSKKPFLIIELHQELKYDYDKGYEYYKGAFDRMVSENGYEMNMTNEDFYVYILSHTAHHFETAGTGIKSIVDHYCLMHKLKPLCDSELLGKALADIGLADFDQRLESLCEFWFGAGESHALIKQMSDFIILSGVFGNEANSYLNGVAQGRYENSSGSYFISRLFPPLKKMAYRYPVLKKLPVLLPLFWGIRIMASIVDKNRIAEERKTVSSVNDVQKENQKKFLEDMGL